MKRRVVLAPTAQEDLRSVYDFIADASGTRAAISYVNRIIDHCASFAEYPARGTLRNDLKPGIRLTGFEGRVTIAFHFDDAVVVIDRILYGGRDLGQVFD